MKTAPSIHSATVILAVFLCLGICSNALNACQDCFCVSDNTCTNAGCTPGLTANCTRMEFSPSCSGVYTLYTETRCTGQNGVCSKCRSCANVFKVTGSQETWIVNGHTDACDWGICTSTSSVELGAGAQYVIYVCKIPCPGGSCGANCTESCTAYACLSYGVASGQCIP